MKRKLVLGSVVIGASLLMSGCIIVDADKFDRDDHYVSDHQRAETNRGKISLLTVNAGLSDIRQQLGTPDFTESYDKNDQRIEVLFYRTHRTKGDGMTTKDECTPLVFVNKALVGWGQPAYERALGH